MVGPIVPIPNASSNEDGGGTLSTGVASTISGRMRYERPYALFKTDTTTFNTVANNMVTTVPWGGVGALNVNIDPLRLWGGFLAAPSNVKMVAPVQGIYQFNVEVGWFCGANNPTGVRVITANASFSGGGLQLVSQNFLQAAAMDQNATHTQYQNLVWTVALAIGDFVEVDLFQTSTGVANLAGVVPSCQMQFLGPF